MGQFEIHKKDEDHIGAVAMYFMFHNHFRIHQTLRFTLAMEAGLTDYVGGVEEIVSLLESR